MFLYLYNQSCLGLSITYILKFTNTKVGEVHLKMVLFGSHTIKKNILKKFPGLDVSLCQRKLSTSLHYTKRMYSTSIISCFFYSVNCFCFNKTSVFLFEIRQHALISICSSSVSNKGCALPIHFHWKMSLYPRLQISCQDLEKQSQTCW